MPRRRRLRHIMAPPNFKGYKPYGANTNEKAPVELHYEEYEAIRLADYTKLSHLEASRLMEVSRSTFARIYESARRKVSQALVETREIKTVYGSATLDRVWYLCQRCYVRFPSDTQSNTCCNLCGSEAVELIS